MHRNAPLTPEGRLRLCRLIEDGWTVASAAESFRISRQTAHKLWRRYQDAGVAGLEDRSSRPRRCPTKTPDRMERRIVELRRRHQLGPARLAPRIGMPASTFHRVLQRHGVRGGRSSGDSRNGDVLSPGIAAGPGCDPPRRAPVAESSLGGTGLAHQSAGPALGEPVLLLDHRDRRTAPCRAQNFPSGTSSKAAMSKAWLANDALQLGALVLELLQALHVVGLHRAVLLAPAVMGLLGDLEMPAHRRNVGSFTEESVRLEHSPDDLFGCMTSVL